MENRKSTPSTFRQRNSPKSRPRLRNIKLTDIVAEGESFELSLINPEVWDGLTDLLGPAKTQARLEGLVRIYRIGSGRYTLKGQITCSYPDACSRCGLDFNQSLQLKCDEILLAALEAMPRNSSYKKTNPVSQSIEVSGEVESLEVQGGIFDLIKYLHEQIGLNQPLYPVPPTDKDRCSLCLKDIREGAFDYQEPDVGKLSPFEVLKSLKCEST
jgi:uncharacterized metal-binding protein YceD (DUF177 family)